MSNVYFIECEPLGAIKIGFSQDVESRLADLQVANSSKLKLLLKVPGNRAVEYRLHRRFRSACLSGEWFKADAVRPLIQKLASMTESQIEIELAAKDENQPDFSGDHPSHVEALIEHCISFIRERGVAECAQGLDRKQDRVTPDRLRAVLSGREAFDAKWIGWFALKSEDVEDAIEHINDWRTRSREDATGQMARLRLAARDQLGPDFKSFNREYKADIKARREWKQNTPCTCPCTCARSRYPGDEIGEAGAELVEEIKRSV